MDYFYHFAYRAKTPEGEIKKGTLFFAQRIIALAWLLRQGWEVEKLTLLPFYFEWRKYLSRPLSGTVLTSFLEQLLSLLSTQWSLLDSLNLLQQTYPHARMRRVIALLATELEQGVTFSQTLTKHLPYLGSSALHLLSMGENTGTLHSVLVQIIKQRKQIDLLTQKMRQALRYPLFLLFISLLIIGALFTLVIPQFMPLYAELGDALPHSTQQLLTVSLFLQKNGLFLMFGISTLAGIVSILFSKICAFKKALQHALYYCPFIHPLIRDFLCSRVLHCLAISLSAQTPMLNALHYARESANHAIFDQALSKIMEQLEAGESLYQCFVATQCFPKEVLHFIQIGEKSGQLPQMFTQAATLSYTHTENRLQQVSQWLEPAMMLIIGSFIAFIVLSLYSPILSLGQVIQ